MAFYRGTGPKAVGHCIPETGATSQRFEVDCPKCKYGTLVPIEDTPAWRCIDCKHRFDSKPLPRFVVRRP